MITSAWVQGLNHHVAEKTQVEVKAAAPAASSTHFGWVR